MKILYVIDHLRLDGTQCVLKQLVEGLAARGHEQAVICLNDSWDAGLVDSLQKAGTPVHVVGKRALLRGVGLLTLWSKLHHGRFDVVVTLLFAADTLGRTVSRAAGVPRIVSALRARNVHYTLWQRWLVRGTMRWADAVVINSASGRDFAIAAEGAPPNRIHIIPNGVRVEDDSAPRSRTVLRAGLGLAAEGWLVGSMGRLTHQKGFDVLLHALSLLSPQAVHLLLLGTGEQETHLRRLAIRLGIQNRVHFLGYRRDVPRVLGALDLYVHPARFEGMPNALLEAMAARCPIVASAVDGICDLIEDGVHGWLVPAEHTSALAEAIQAALSDPIEGQRRAVAAQQRVASHFSIDAMVAAWEGVLMGRG